MVLLLLYIVINSLFYYVLKMLCLVFVWCPCMTINNVRSAQCNGGFLPDIILLTHCYHQPTGNPFKCHEEALYLQPMIPPKRFDIFPPD